MQLGDVCGLFGAGACILTRVIVNVVEYFDVVSHDLVLATECLVGLFMSIDDG